MGSACGCGRDQETLDFMHGKIDLPVSKLEKPASTDPVRAFELSFPFARTNVLFVIDTLHCLGEKKKVKREELEKLFTTPAWKKELSRYGRVT